ncbi:helix-turn-helix domain-containing protein [Vogesella sp. AC12]|uniref:winged helix-turn-helix transcriptional regulator n=1 Tax=Vogesella sp. AC12 TaxID=2950550 RepID=UPI00210C982A|nr:helix-turn-helix domain-containing protein [Vogesella sp. AC12]MCQ4146103.1 helix-turn-helix transcriptional regulator [Vogesella sp. AC12]
MFETDTGKLAAAMRRGDVLAAQCPSREILKHVTSQWGILVLMALMEGTHRFSELRRKIGGVSEKMLAQTLQQLEQDGFVSRVSYPVVPPHVEYSLTPLGEGIGLHVEALTDWIEHNLPNIIKSQQSQAPKPQ